MITIKQWMEVVNFRITEGSDYYNYGYGTYALSSWGGEQTSPSFEIIFNPATQEVYEVQAHDYKNNRAYRLVNPAHRDAASSDEEAYEGVNYTDLETPEDWLEKATAIIEGKPYDTRIAIPFELPQDEMFVLMKAAHEADMTFNAYIIKLLESAIQDPTFVERHKK
jgi:hypothetical protein